MTDNTRSIPFWTTSVFSSIVTDLVLIYESVTSSTNDSRIIKDEWRKKNESRTNYVYLLYNFQANRIEITTSNSSSIIPCPSVAAQTYPANRYLAMEVFAVLLWLNTSRGSGVMSQYCNVSPESRDIGARIVP
jgi:hypothetical protein